MSKKMNYTKQMNAKMTQQEFDKLQAINQTLFGGQLNNSDLARALLNIAVQTLQGAKVEVKTTKSITLNSGKTVQL